MLHTIYKNVHLFIVESDQTVDRSAFEIRIPVPPDNVVYPLLRRDLDVVVLRFSLKLRMVRPALYHYVHSTSLVRAPRFEVGRHEQIESAVGFRDVGPHR